MTELTIGTYNLYQRSDDDKADDALDSFVERVDIAGLQEYGGAIRRKSLNDLFGFDYFKPKDTPTAPPIVWDEKRFEFIEGNAVLVAAGRKVGSAPGKRSVLGDYHATVVELWDHKADEEIVVGNIHTPAHVEFWPGPRRTMYRESLVNTAKAMDLHKDRPAFLVGDFNWSLTKAHGLPRTLLAKHDLRCCFDAHRHYPPTEGKRTIDGVFSNLRAAETKVLTAFHVGDHKPVTATYNLTNGVK